MATARRRVTRSAEPRTAAEVADLAPSGPKPAGADLTGELQGIAHAAGAYLRALREEGVPRSMRIVMFDNWQRSLFGVYDTAAGIVEDGVVPDDDELESV